MDGLEIDDLDDEEFADALNDAMDWLAEIAPDFDPDDLDPDDARELLEIVADRAAEEMREDALDLISELEDEGAADFAAFGPASDAIGRFFRKAAKTLRVAYLAAALVVLGPDGMDADAREAAGVQVARQGAYLRQFEEQVRSGAQGADGSLAARAEMYGVAANGVGQNVAAAIASSRGMVEEKRTHYGSDKPCPTCTEEQAKGWQPIGTLKEISDSECRIRCHCRFSWRDAAGNEYDMLPEA